VCLCVCVFGGKWGWAQVSYMEIYNERVFDLLGDVRSKKTLKVREHKILGPYVEVCRTTEHLPNPCKLYVRP